jgi:hypothetical protein
MICEFCECDVEGVHVCPSPIMNSLKHVDWQDSSANPNNYIIFTDQQLVEAVMKQEAERDHV